MKILLTLICFAFWASVVAQPAQLQVKPARPFELGWVQEIHSTILSENRTINIYLPEGYRAQDTIRYPVIYLLDGGTDEDFVHVVGLVQFNSMSWVNQLAKSIVVGITNVDRKRDFTYPSSRKQDLKMCPTSGQSAKFIAFLERELQPYVAAHYSTTASKTLIGESLGGLLATEVLLKKPGLFNKYIIISPSLWWDNGSLLKPAAAELLKGSLTHTQVYIGVGKEGLAPTEPPHVMEVDANLLADRLKSLNNDHLQVYFDYLPTENHASIMHQAVFNAFKLFNNKPTEVH